MTTNRPVRIGLLWHSANSGNLGVGALTEANLALLRREVAALGLVAEFVIIGFKDPWPDYVTGADVSVVKLSTRTMLSPAGYWRELSGLDCIFDIGGGDSWADIYGWKRFGFLWLTKVLAAWRTVPLVFSPQTIGPFTRAPYLALASFAMRRATHIVVRDPLSRDVAAMMVPGKAIVEAVDVAFALPFDQAAQATDGVTQVGINVSGLLFNKGYGGDNAFGLEADYAALMRTLVAELVARSDVKVFLFTHVVAPDLPMDDDGPVADSLAADFPSVERVANFASPSAAKSFISGMDFVVSGRMHACIAAYSSGVPVVPVAYSRKFSGLFEGVLGYPHAVPVTGLSTEGALAHILNAFANRHKLAAEIEIGNRKVAAALDRYRAVIRDLLQDVAK